MSSEILEMIRKRNEDAAVEHELKRQAAMKKIKELRRQQLKAKERKQYGYDISG